MLLTDEEITKARKKAADTYKRHYYSIRGQQVTEADDPEMHLIWAIIAAYEAKLREQKPVCVVSENGVIQNVTDRPLEPLLKLFTHPAPIPDQKTFRLAQPNRGS